MKFGSLTYLEQAIGLAIVAADFLAVMEQSYTFLFNKSQTENVWLALYDGTFSKYLHALLGRQVGSGL